ncbi:jupiter microtubule associated homolog 1 isoform X2 [Bombina bombina]|uniref:jupiter microtubule associated homolog 1 isoform X2 n=1 Tax=Bombina bombina TaxID=8345 RepID=UPI00235AB7F8|nr:jupiter microtubule associated homolog 1 isoform X2 [Bombina bombina]
MPVGTADLTLSLGLTMSCLQPWVLRPPGGGSSFTFGASDDKAQPARRYKMASNIFGIPDNDPIPPPQAQKTGVPENTDSEVLDDVEQRTCPDGECGDAADEKGEAETPETQESEKEAPPAEPAPTYGRRNPPGGKSSLVLG